MSRVRLIKAGAGVPDRYQPVADAADREEVPRSVRVDLELLSQPAHGDPHVGRLGFVGSNPTTRPLIEASFKRALEILDTHLAARPYVLGGRPAMADFGLWGQFYEAATDPTPAAIMRAEPNVMAWVQRMVSPKAEGPFESWSALSAGLMPLLTEEVGRLFLPWSAANAEAIAKGEKTFTMSLGGAEWTQEPQKYHARSLQEIRRKYAAAKSAALDEILEKAGCLSVLRSGA